MRFGRTGLLLCLVLLLGVKTKSQQAPAGATTAAQDQQAVTLVQASLSTLMGTGTVMPTSIVAAGTTTPVWDSSTPPYAVRIYVQGTDKFRWEEDLLGGTTATVVNGQSAQSQQASTAAALMPWQVGTRKIENFPILLLSRWLSSDSVLFHFVGLDTVDGQNLNHISVIDLSQRTHPQNPWHRDRNRGQYELYLDPATSYPVRLHYYQDTSDTILYSLLPVDVVYSDFRLTGGFVFPYGMTRYSAARKLAVIQLQSVQPNVVLSSQEFQIR